MLSFFVCLLNCSIFSLGPWCVQNNISFLAINEFSDILNVLQWICRCPLQVILCVRTVLDHYHHNAVLKTTDACAVFREVQCIFFSSDLNVYLKAKNVFNQRRNIHNFWWIELKITKRSRLSGRMCGCPVASMLRGFSIFWTPQTLLTSSCLCSWLLGRPCRASTPCSSPTIY